MALLCSWVGWYVHLHFNKVEHIVSIFMVLRAFIIVQQLKSVPFHIVMNHDVNYTVSFHLFCFISYFNGSDM